MLALLCLLCTLVGYVWRLPLMISVYTTLCIVLSCINDGGSCPPGTERTICCYPGFCPGMDSVNNPLQKMGPGSDPLNALHWSLAHFSLDASSMFQIPREVTPLSQDLPFFSYYDPSRMDYYYGAIYSLPSSGQTYGSHEDFYGPAYVRKRNERERQRVKCVNDGYAKLRHHLPREYAEKRLSKVQTLRAAIRYIGHLQEALRWGGCEETRRMDIYRRNDSQL